VGTPPDQALTFGTIPVGIVPVGTIPVGTVPVTLSLSLWCPQRRIFPWPVKYMQYYEFN